MDLQFFFNSLLQSYNQLVKLLPSTMNDQESPLWPLAPLLAACHACALCWPLFLPLLLLFQCRLIDHPEQRRPNSIPRNAPEKKTQKLRGIIHRETTNGRATLSYKLLCHLDRLSSPNNDDNNKNGSSFRICRMNNYKQINVKLNQYSALLVVPETESKETGGSGGGGD